MGLAVYITGALILTLFVVLLVFLTMNIHTAHKLWLDDERPAPEGWYWAKSPDEALAYLQSYTVLDMSLDHDLGICQDCKTLKRSCHHDGYYTLKQMAERNLWPKNKPTVHSMNPVGRERMVAFIDRYFPG